MKKISNHYEDDDDKPTWARMAKRTGSSPLEAGGRYNYQYAM
jgi:hypothetical protein